MLGTGLCAPEVPEQNDSEGLQFSGLDLDVAGPSPVKEKHVGVSVARLLPIGDTDQSHGHRYPHVVFVAGNGHPPGTNRERDSVLGV